MIVAVTSSHVASRSEILFQLFIASFVEKKVRSICGFCRTSVIVEVSFVETEKHMRSVSVSKMANTVADAHEGRIGTKDSLIWMRN